MGMRVLQVSDHFPPQAGGLAIQVQRLGTRLITAGHEAAVFTVGGPSESTMPDGMTVFHHPHSFGRVPGVYQPGSPPFHPPWPDPEFRRGLRRTIEAFRPDVLHVHGWSVFSATSLGAGRPPIVCSLHDYGMLCPKKSLLRHGAVCAEGRGLRCVTCDSQAQPTPRRSALSAALGLTWPWLQSRVFRFLAVSSYVRERHLESGLEGERIVVIPPLIDPLPAGPPAERGRSGPYVLYVGPGDEGPHKGRSVLLRAFARIDPMDHVLLLVGGREQIAASGHIEDAGYLRGESLAAAFRGASIAVVPSVWADPCPAVAVEALSVGCPVIASAIGGLTDIVEHDRTGLLVPPADEQALAAALQRLVADRELRATMSGRARGSVARYSTDAVLPPLVETYQAGVDSVRR
jgi:glycosyltransferase involved in cell wall biosynthesis